MTILVELVIVTGRVVDIFLELMYLSAFGFREVSGPAAHGMRVFWKWYDE